MGVKAYSSICSKKLPSKNIQFDNRSNKIAVEITSNTVYRNLTIYKRDETYTISEQGTADIPNLTLQGVFNFLDNIARLKNSQASLNFTITSLLVLPPS